MSRPTVKKKLFVYIVHMNIYGTYLHRMTLTKRGGVSSLLWDVVSKTQHFSLFYHLVMNVKLI
jgi:hypothetical protein